ncbi:cyclic nucleotide-binding domain-containing protein [bacterium]|nr:cyclic nucleotide-binding domain-containing protein [bacterium]
MNTVLSECFLFSGWSAQEVKQVAALCREKSLSVGQMLFSEGASSTSLYVVQSGSIKIEKASGDDDQMVAQFSKGSCFGEMGMLSTSNPGPRSASATASESSVVLELNYADLEKLIEEHVHLGAKLYKALAESLSTRIRKTTQDLASLKSLRLRHV